MTLTVVVELVYLAAGVLFILALRGLTKPDKARRGMQQAMVGMLLAVIATLLKEEIIDYDMVLIGLVIGSIAGYPLGQWVPMTAMPQRIAFSHMFGALAATLVGIAEYTHAIDLGEGLTRFTTGALGFEVLFGGLTVTGSFIAFLERDALPDQ